jgi:hypothetical protein
MHPQRCFRHSTHVCSGFIYCLWMICVYSWGDAVVRSFTCQRYGLLRLTPCNLVSGYQYFGGMWLLYLPWRWRQQVPPTEVHSLISHPLVWESRNSRNLHVSWSCGHVTRSLKTKFLYEMIKFLLQSLLHIVCATVWLTYIFTVLEYLKAFFCDGTRGVVVRL